MIAAALWHTLAATVALADGEPEPAKVKSTAVRVLAIGDSFTAGLVSGEPAPAYVEILRTTLGREFEVVNLGCSGSTILDWTRPPWEPPACTLGGAYELKVPSAIPADLATILLGTNDAFGFVEGDCVEKPKWTTRCPVSRERYETKMIALIDRLVADGVPRIILIKPANRPVGDVEVIGRLHAYGEALDEICKARRDVTCGPDLFDLLDVERDFNEQDFHPNANGHRLIGEALAPIVRSVAKR